MSYEDIIRAWKNEDYRMSLSEEERAQLPDHPAGLIELTDSELELVGGGYLMDDDNGAVETTPCSTSLACPNSCGDKNCGKKKVDDESSESLWLL